MTRRIPIQAVSEKQVLEVKVIQEPLLKIEGTRTGFRLVALREPLVAISQNCSG